MKKNHQNLKAVFLLGFFALVGVGTYNALVINSTSGTYVSGHFKRIDEVLGEVKAGRTIAVEARWQKIGAHTPVKVRDVAVAQDISIVSQAVTVNTPAPEAFIQETLELKLAEVANPRTWKEPLKTSQFNGSITTNNGVIESLNVSLPGFENISVSFAELAGNVFEYEYQGQVYSGLMYQVDSSSFMVTLTHGPLEGTRLRFNSGAQEPAVEQEMNQQFLAETHNVQPGSFGSEEVQPIEAPVAELNPENNELQAPGFNFEAQSI